MARRQGRHSPAASGGRVWRQRSDTKRCPYFFIFIFGSGRRRRCFSDVSLGVAFWGDVQVVKLLSSMDVYRPRVVILHGGGGEWTASAWIVPRKKASRDAQVASHGSQIRRLICARVLHFFAHRPDHEEGRETVVVVRCGSSISSQSPGLTVRRNTYISTHSCGRLALTAVTELPFVNVGGRNKTASSPSCMWV